MKREYIVEVLLWVTAENETEAEVVGKGFASFARKESQAVTAAVVAEVRSS